VTSLVRCIARAAFLIPCMLICVSCAQFPAELAPDGADKSIIAIKVKTKKSGFLAWLEGSGACMVFFLRLKADGQNRQQDLPIASNYNRSGYLYVVNASPGRYVAIGALLYCAQTRNLSPRMTYLYFPESMIDETTVTVEPSGVAFMGEFEVSGSLQFDDADDMQKHYAKRIRIALGYTDQGFVNGELFAGCSFFHAGSPCHKFITEYQKDQSEMATERFMKSSQLLAEIGWRALNGDE
jgi:hypothetical protein